MSLPSVPQALLEFLSKYERYVIAGHKEPDGDCIGSCLAMANFLQRKKKETLLLNAGPFDKPEVKEYEGLFKKELSPEFNTKKAGLLVLDCSGLDRVGDIEKQLEGFDTAIIDHHATNQTVSKSSLVMKTSPSTTYLIQAIIEAVDGEVTPKDAEYLFFGLCTDTGFFRHLDERSANVFAQASRLISKGVNPKSVFAKMYGGKSFGSRILISRILERLTPYYDGRLMVSYEELKDTQEFGLSGRDSDTLYQLIQSIEGVQAIVVVRQESETHCSVGFRSLDSIDVSVVAKSFGGGGHKQASGLYIEGKINELIPQFVKAFADQFS
ncbi:MAG: DHH family phosphoesterase [Treponema sp.]|nr:MAG: DHH family phosphoesterase [Treponema sp.]